MTLGDTIVACASPPGRSARALVRVSGPGSRRLAEARLGIGPDIWQAGAFEATFRLPRAQRVASARALDGRSADATLPLAVRVILSVAPRSYTGEDAIEIIIPGNPVLVERVIDALCDDATTEHPVRRAGPGEFSARAYLNGKLTIEAAEGVSATIHAASEAELEAARRAMRGEDAASWRAWTDEAATLLALVEAGIDFTDQEDVVAIVTPVLLARADALRAAIAGVLGGERAASVARHTPRVVIAGRPNAGKSTLLNAIIGRRRAVVSDQAGTTRDLLVEVVDLSRLAPGGPEIELVDMAGLDPGDAHGSKSPAERAIDQAVEGQMRSRAREAIGQADVVLWCDPDARFEAGDGIAPAASATVVRVRTKADRVGGPASGGVAEGSQGSDVVPVCALDGWNLGVLASRVAESVVRSRAAAASGAGHALLARHRRALAEAEGTLGEAVSLAGRHARDDAAIAAALRTTVDALGSITGRLSPDDVLGLIFARFCVGK